MNFAEFVSVRSRLFSSLYYTAAWTFLNLARREGFQHLVLAYLCSRVGTFIAGHFPRESALHASEKSARTLAFRNII